MNADERCGTCRFYDSCSDQLDDQDEGQCRRHPPVVCPQVIAAYYLQEYEEGESPFFAGPGRQPLNPWESHWPWVHAHDWCGEYRPRVSLPVVHDDSNDRRDAGVPRGQGGSAGIGEGRFGDGDASP